VSQLNCTHTCTSLKQYAIDKVELGKEMEIVCRMKTTNSSALEYNAGVQWWTRIGMLLSI